jgi:hypothetical protein
MCRELSQLVYIVIVDYLYSKIIVVTVTNLSSYILKLKILS